jgi:hypothetical protein
LSTVSLESALDQGRAAAESRMLDKAEIRYKTGATTTDPVTGSETAVYAVRFTTKCRVKSTRTYGVQNQEVGGRTARTVTRELHIPVDSAEVQPGDLAVMTAVHPTTDPTLLNAELTISGPAPGSQTTARRLEITEVTS